MLNSLIRSRPLWTLAPQALLVSLALTAGAQTSGVYREVYTNIAGTVVADLLNNPKFPNSPDVTGTLTTSFEAPTNIDDNYGQRCRARITPPTSGYYTFWIASDDASTLYLSSDETPANKAAIAAVSGWTSSRQWTKEAGQQSAPQYLVAGVPYYIEALQKEGGGGDNLAVRWQLPGGAFEEPVPASRLTAFTGLPSGPPNILFQPTNTTVAEGSSVIFRVIASNQDPLTYQWQRNSNNLPGATGSSLSIPWVSSTNNGAYYRCILNNSYGSATSVNARLTVTGDTTPPVLLSASAEGNTRVRVRFSELLQPASATNRNNYAITWSGGSLAVVSANFAEDDTATVYLNTAQQNFDTPYTLTVNGVRDASSNANLVAANSQSVFTNRLFTVGYIKREIYTGISGSAVADLTGNAKYPNSPDQVDYPSSAGWPVENINENYGARISGFLVPPVSGSYTFAIRSDDASQVYLGTNESPAGKVLLTQETGCCNAFDAHISAPVVLEAGRRYYLEALMKEGTGGDYLYVAWKTPWDSGNWNVIPGDYLGNYFMPSGSTITVLQQPINTSTIAGQNAMFTVAATGNSSITTNVTYQWQVNSLDIPGATAATLITAPVNDPNDGDLYRCALTIPGLRTFSSSAVLTVLPDVYPPTIARVFNIGTTNVQVVFSEPVEVASGTNRFNHVFNNGVTVSGAAMGVDSRSVVLNTSPLTLGNSYTVYISNVRDRATAPNPIAPVSPYTFFAAPYAPQDIGNPRPAGTFEAVSGGYNATAGGSGISGSSDQFQFSYERRTGDFDLKVRVQVLSLADLWSQAGLMARETLDPGSAFAAALATPSLSGTFFQSRTIPSGNATSAGSFPVNYPYTWLRLRRAGNVFTGYASFDGQTWTSLGSVTIAMSSTIYFGLAASSHTISQAAVAEFRDIGSATAGSGGVLPPGIEPMGPSSRKTSLVISEIMYKPAPRSDTNNLEFVELFNSNPWWEDISGYRLSGDIDFTFPPGTILPGGGFLVVAKQPSELQSLYGLSGVTILGPYTNTLKVPGTVRLRNKEDSILLEVNYSSKPPWPVGADATGHSLVLARPSYGEDYPQGWEVSDTIGGSPGSYNGFEAVPERAVVINEFLAHTDLPLVDYVELYNHGNATLDLTGCVLTDDASTNRFVLPPGSVILPRGFLTFDENELGFALSSTGERLYLKSADLTRVLDAIEFDAQANGVSMGRWPNGADEFHPMQTRTPGAANSAIRIHDIVINEIMYEPISGLSDDKYVELHNKGASSVNLSGWRFTSGIDYTFPNNTTLAAGGYLVVAQNPARLIANYPNLTAANTYGPFDDKLSGGGERLALGMPDQIVTTNASGGVKTNTIHIVVDEVTYRVGGRWARWANGGGSSLELIDPRANHRLAANWADSDESAKAPWTTIEATAPLELGGGYSPDNLQVVLLDAGECLLDNVEVTANGGANLVSNPTFESGMANWFPQGDHVNSSLGTGSGFGGGNALHIRASARGDTGANRVRASLTSALSAGQTGTIRAKVRWLRGWPEIVLRLRGNYLEATGFMNLPVNLGTPGAPNSRRVTNAGPAIYEVAHSPVVPAGGQNVVVTARVHDPNGVSSLAVKYRVDPNWTFSTVTMRDDGAGGDAVAGDGVFSATIPGQSAGTIIAFHLEATDGSAATTRFPAEAPIEDCVVMFGDTIPAGSFGTYRLWITQTNVNTWINRPSLSNERIDFTFVYGHWRAVYNAGVKYAGSPYHQGFPSPLTSGCHYSIEMPDDDRVLGTDNFNKIHAPGNGPFDDNTIQREQTSYWMVRQLGLPWNYRRFVAVFANGNRRGTLMEDTQTPNREVVEEHFPDDPDGQLYKLQPWFEFDDVNVTGGTGAGFQNVSWCTLNRYLGSDGRHKLARYRWNYLTRAQDFTANDYTNVFNLVDAAATADSAAHVAAMERLVDMEQWMRTFAVEHAVGNWDAFGCNNAQNMYGYKPRDGRWQLLIWDYNIVLGNSGSWGPGAELFTVTGSDAPMRRLYNTPAFRRMYWRGLKDLCNYAMVNAHVDPVMDAKYAAFQASGIGVTSPSSVKQWIASARTSILAQLDADGGNQPFSIDGPSSVSINSNLVVLTGRAPVDVRTITVNGVEWPAEWTSVNSWRIRVPVAAGANPLAIVGLDYYGNLVVGASNQVTVTYTGSAVSPVGLVVINEIMYNPAAPDASYVEIHNASSTTYFDLSSWRLNGADFTFSGGSVLAPGGFLLAVKDYDKFLAAYGPNRPVAGEFNGSLDNGGETLQLIRPGATPDEDLVVCEVRYDDDPPWPVEADGTGPSLQLRDATEDIRRVANWGVGGETTGSEPGWQYVAVTGTASSSRLYIYLNSAGDFYLDDLQLVAGSVAGAGANMIQNGDFESALSGPWTVSANLSGSAISTAIKHTGNGSLHVVSSSGGTTQGSSIWQNTLPLTGDATYTLSYWYRPSTNGNQLTIRLSGNGIISTHSIAPPLVPASGPFTPGMINSIATNLAALPPLWLNEVMPNNTTNLADRFGHFEPWAELHNAGATAIHLSGYYLTDDFATPLKWAFPTGAWIQPNGFRVIFADGVPGESITNELHTSFRLNSATGAVALVRLDNGQPQIVDYLNYRLVSEGRSYGSLPDGQPVHRQLFSIPTPGGTNNGAYPPALILINEWMAGNSTIPDPADGDFDDWFELYNAGTTAVDLGGYRLTDNLADPGQFTIPSGVGIGPGGFLLVWADDETGQNGGDDLHTNFKLSVGGEAIGLYDPNLNLVDTVTFPAQTSDVSQGRSPDGFPAPFEWLPTPTPGGPNSSTSGNTPPTLAAVGDKAVDEGALLDFDLTATDSDVPAQTLTFTLDPGVPAGANVSGGGSFTWTPTEGQGPGVYTVTARVTDNGVPPLSDTKTFQIVVAEANEPPLLTAITNRTINEGLLHTFSASATDVDVPANELTFSLDPGAPAGAAIHPTTGAFTWMPSENQGPGLFDITVRVTDDGVPALSDFKTLTITVNEANNPPSLVVPPTQTTVESHTLTVTNTATDSDLPAQPLTFGLVSAPSGVNLNTSSGVLTWTPTEAQGPSTNTITVRVFDNGAPSLSSTQSFIVIVLETNSAPGLTVPATQTLFELATLTVTNTATDNDLPAQTLTFGLVSAPSGVNLNAGSGVLTWTPGEAQGPSTNTIVVRAFDDGAPSLSVTQSFAVIVLETNRAPTLNPIGNKSVTTGEVLSFTATASDGDLPVQTLSFSLDPGAPASASMDPVSGQFTWTPDATQAGPHSITVRVRDNGNPALEDSEAVTITVNVPTITVSLLSITNEWRYDQSGNDLGTAWRGTGFDDSAWAQGAALLCNETATLPAPKNTPLSLTNGAGARVITYYFRAEFWLPADPSGVVLTASNLIDDGAVFYLNGTEVGRYNLPGGTVTAATLASNTVNNATAFQVLSLPSNSLVTGRNVLAVEVHQINDTSTDVVFGLSLDAELPAQEPLSITNQPQSLAVTAGDTAQFSVGASGDFPQYQWFKDGNLIPGANGPVLVLNHVQSSDAGVYRAVVTNLVSAAISEAALLTVNPPPNTPPTLLPLGDRSVIELTTLAVTNLAFDDDLPPQSLTFALVLAPTGVDLNPGTGGLTWTPTEAQGPGSNTITVRVFDNGTPSLSATQSFTVIVLETNSAPTLTVPPTQTVTELADLSVNVTAVDSDLPAQSLTFALVLAPTGVDLNPGTGGLTWTPTEAQGPHTNTITVRVFDNGTPSLSATQSFTVIVFETNSAPTLSPIPDQFVSEGALLSLTLSASDPDLPAQSLSFSLEPGAPSGAMVGATNGVLTWTPPIGHQPATNQITVRVTDDGVPSLSNTRTFQAVVVSAPVVRIETPSSGTATIRWPTVVGRRYQVQFKDNLEDGWADLGTAITAAGSITTVTDDMNGRSHRFYRIVLLE